VGSRAASIAIGCVAAAGVPLLWVWLASELAGESRELTPSLALFIGTGIIVSYWVVLMVGGWLRGRRVDPDEERARARRASWNRSFREEAIRPGESRSDPIELAFVVVAVLAVIAFEIWFFFFAGSPLPNQPLF
jgi:hypothetical protein